MQDVLIKLMLQKLTEEKSIRRDFFHNSKSEVGVRYCSVDDLLPIEVALKIADGFPHFTEMRRMKSIREDKYTSKNFDRFNSILKDMTFALQDPKIIFIINQITGIEDQMADPLLYAGGLSMMTKNSFLNPHIDNSHDGSRERYRTLNLLYYSTPNWNEEYGGNLELWDSKVQENITIHSKFNRLVLMETNPWSWHSVSSVKVDKSRNCISNYYFSQTSPLKHDYFHVTSYSSRPEEKWKKYLFKSDNFIRNSIRYIFPKGLGKKDIYSPNSKA
jgi:Rps23 Pro-64 3,4-dihydroxylase Tpa1-like proline 4-hydroxylase